jgi:hypothetical protein
MARWHHTKNFFGATEDATVETTMTGAWRVTKENIDTGKKTVRRFAGAAGRQRAMDWARLVTIPPITTDQL